MNVKVVIPALNEEASVEEVVRSLKQVSEVIVVDNGSHDRTAEMAAKAGATVIRENRKGYGSACLAGLSYLRISPPDIVVFVDADLSDDPADFLSLVLPIEKNEAEFVIGSRAFGQREEGAIPPHAFWGTKFAVSLMNLLFKTHYSDLGPFRAIRWEALEQLKMKDTNFGWTIEMQTKAARAKLRVMEVPVRYRKRVGQSKISGTFWGTIRAGEKILRSVLYYRLLPTSYW